MSKFIFDLILIFLLNPLSFFSFIKEFCIFAGHVGVAPHVKIGARSVLAAKTGVSKSLTGGKVYAGMPAREIREQHKREAVYLEVIRIKNRLKRLEK